MSDQKIPNRPPLRDKGVTRRGYVLPHANAASDEGDPTAEILDPESQFDAEEPITSPRPPKPRVATEPSVEVVIVEEDGPMAQRKEVWRALEIWTKNRIYSVDSTMTCIEVIDRESGRPDNNHHFVGARLGGGQRREGSRLKLSHPLPVPGTEAVFKLPAGRQGRFGQTTKVERVVLRLRVSNVPVLDAEPIWEEITHRWSVAPTASPPRGR